MKTNRLKHWGAASAFTVALLSACAPGTGTETSTQNQDDANRKAGAAATDAGATIAAPGIVKARARLNIVLSADGHGKGQILAANLVPEGSEGSGSFSQEVEILNAGNIPLTDGPPVSVTLPALTTYSVDTSSFIPNPTLSNASISFGSLKLGQSFFDNNLKVCATSANGQCQNAVLRAYTTQPASVTNPGDGLWNATDGYGVPLYIKAADGTENVIQLGQAASQTLQTVGFQPSQKVLTATDFKIDGLVKSYDVRADFSLAGAGTYAATIIIEYVLN